MKLSFTFDINDLFDVHLRSARRARALRPNPWFGSLWSLLAMVPTIGWSVYMIGRPESNYPLVLAFAGIAGALGRWYQAKSGRARVFDHLESTYGSRGPFRCEVELGPEGITTRQFDEEMRRPWTLVAAVRDTADGVEVDFGPRGVLMVRPNAFSHPTDRTAFVRYAEARIQNATTTGPNVSGAAG
jgi:hypothetical protein